MQRVLVTGVDNMLGSNLAWALSGRCDVLGVHGQLDVESPCFPTRPWNPLDAESTALLLDSWRPQWVVHCPLLANSSWDIELGYETLGETEIAGNLVAATAARGCALTVITSDTVFDGPRMFHDETSIPSAVSPAAQNCLALERALADSPALVIRTHAYGWSGDAGRRCFAEQAYEALRHGQLPALTGRRYATPILASDLADLLWHAHQIRLQGLLHLAGAERTSMQRFVREIAACLGVPCPEERPGKPEHVWHEETSLSSRRARRILARPTPLLREGIERFLAQADGQKQPRWHLRSRAKALVAA